MGRGEDYAGAHPWSLRPPKKRVYGEDSTGYRWNVGGNGLLCDVLGGYRVCSAPVMNFISKFSALKLPGIFYLRDQVPLGSHIFFLQGDKRTRKREDPFQRRAVTNLPPRSSLRGSSKPGPNTMVSYST